MMMYYYTKFGYKRFSNSEDIVRTNIKTLNLCSDLDLEHSNLRLVRKTTGASLHGAKQTNKTL